MLHEKGNRFLFIGASDTGKTHECKEFAKYFREREQSPKRTIVFNHSENDDSYADSQVIGLNDLDSKLPKKGNFMVNVDLRENPEHLELFISKVQRHRNSTIIFDDSTGLFKGGIPKYVINFLGTRKNNRLEIMFQIHSIKGTHPDLLENSDIWVLKQTRDRIPIKDTCPDADIVGGLIQECKDENARNYYKNLWATRIFVGERNKIYRKDLSKPFLQSYQEEINALFYQYQKNI